TGAGKKDYQTDPALRPSVRICDKRVAERIDGVASATGVGSIDVGGLVGWAFELVAGGPAEPAAFGISGVPKVDPETFDPEADSERNARLAIGMIDALAEIAGRDDLPALRRGLRPADAARGGHDAR